MSTGIWRVADYRNLWLSQSVSLLGTQITLLAFPLLAILLIDASALQVSLLAALEFLPVLLFGLPAGAWVDRLPRRPIMIISDVGRAVALATVPIAYVLGVLNLPLLYVVAFVIGLGTLFYDVAQQSFLPALVEDDLLVDANAKLEMSRSVSQLAGPSAGGFLVALFSAPLAIALDALSYVASTFFLLSVRGRETKAEPIEPLGLGKEIGDGLRFVFGHRLMRPLAIAAGTADLAFAAVLALQVVYAVKTLHLSAAAIGITLAVGNAGGLLGAVLCARITDRVGPGRAILGSIAIFSVGAAVLPLAGGAVVFAVGLFIVYFGVVVFNVVQITLCQTLTPAGMLGRMNATLRFITWGMVPVGAAVGGLLVEPLGLRNVLWIAAGVTALSIVAPLLSPLRSLRSDPPPPDDDAPAAAPIEIGVAA